MRRLVAQVVAEHGTRILASVIRACGGDFALSEDAVQEAVLAALEHWPASGVPSRCDAWLITTARHRAIDQLRRDQRLARKQEQMEQLLALNTAAEGSDWQTEETPAVEDDRLRLIFTCCHPALGLEAQISLTLRTVAGLDTFEIARAFLVTTDTMAKRLTRARTKIRDARIPYQIPAEHELPDRLEGVLNVIYLIFNEGYLSAAAPSLVRADLCDEAIRLARILLELMPDELEVRGLLALMLLTDSHRSARTNEQGEFQPLDEQDRSLWDRAKIAEGLSLLDMAERMRKPGRFQLQAAIAAIHAEAPEASATDWHQIARLYAALHGLDPTPVVGLNRAAAVAMAFGPDTGLRLIDELEASAALADYYLLPAARADLLRRAGRLDAAAHAYRDALTLCTNPVERRYLERRLSEVSASA